ncbi:hypothetical protein POTOM_025884 [Populus tomentosa]|uniref:Tetrapyrrole biosynthesis uroporphyrinogen III synthase domain-containing protein n=1 Tax=Populus tomentosa TaxID=118781 RepID=A0A8X8CYW6_POPTO|nr:hypothetical protein POTOM_025884 [Populus tomentosa]
MHSLMIFVTKPSIAFTTPPDFSTSSLSNPLFPSGGPTNSTLSTPPPLPSPPSLLRHRFPFPHLLVPTITTRNGVVHLLGTGRCRKVLCPVPRVVGLEEPPVVPDFLRELEAVGWVPIRVDAYETRWLGPACAKGVVERSDEGLLDAMVFASSGEVEGLLKSLKELGWEWEMMMRRWPNLVVVTHGPVAAAGAASLGVNVNVVSERFDSFQGTVDAVKTKLRGLDSTCM